MSSTTRREKAGIFARVDLIAAERGLSRSEVRRAKQGERALFAFANRHRLSLDWLFRGDLCALAPVTSASRAARINEMDRSARLSWLVDRRIRRSPRVHF